MRKNYCIVVEVDFFSRAYWVRKHLGCGRLRKRRKEGEEERREGKRVREKANLKYFYKYAWKYTDIYDLQRSIRWPERRLLRAASFSPNALSCVFKEVFVSDGNPIIVLPLLPLIKSSDHTAPAFHSSQESTWHWASCILHPRNSRCVQGLFPLDINPGCLLGLATFRMRRLSLKYWV